jgi:heterodisulfide reductase subunit A
MANANTLYKEAREAGCHLHPLRTWKTSPRLSQTGISITVRVTDHVLGLPVEIDADLLTLATAIVPNRR